MAKKQSVTTIDEALSVVEETPTIVHTYYGIQRDDNQNQVVELNEYSNGKFEKTVISSNVVLAVCIAKLQEMVIRTVTIKKQF